KVLSRVFRGKFTAGLKRAFREGELAFFGSTQHLSDEKAFYSFLRSLFRHDWVVYAKEPFGGPEHVLHYLARYTHRVAISNHRLLGMDDGKVTFRWKDYAHGGKQRKMTLATEEFIRRFLLHVLPKGFVRIRHYGWMANRCRSERAAQCRLLLGQEVVPTETTPTRASSPLRQCPFCGGAVEVVEMIVPRELSRHG